MRNPWSKNFLGVLLGMASMMLIQKALPGYRQTSSGQYTGHVTNGGGALAHRRWKRRRAAGNVGRRR